MPQFLSYGKQWVSDDDINAVVEVLRSPYLTQGPAVERFEQEICDYTGAEFCVAVANGTAALHVAVSALMLVHGWDPSAAEGITSPITFAASSNSMIYCGIRPTFADINPDTYTISPQQIGARISSKTKLITPVHFAGQPADMAAIASIARAAGASVIEDAAHAIGSRYSDGDRVGSCKHSEMTIFSFHPVKTVTTGEGGAITTNSKELCDKLRLLRSHGITKDPVLLGQQPGPWYYEMQELGFNYRLSDIHAALGSSQMKRLDSFNQRRREIVDAYNDAFADIEWIKTPFENPDVNSCFHLYVLQIDFDFLGSSRAAVMGDLRAKSVGTQVHYIPVHYLPYYRDRYGYTAGDFPVAEKYYDQALSIPLYPMMSDSDVGHVIEAIRSLGK